MVIPVVLGAAATSVFLYIVMVVSPCGILTECPEHMWRSLGIYVALLSGIGAAIGTGALFALVPWAGPRVRHTTGALIAVAWLVLMVVTLSTVW